MLFFVDGEVITLNIHAIAVEIRSNRSKQKIIIFTKVCYVRETVQFKLSNKNELSDSHKCCPINPFVI